MPKRSNTNTIIAFCTGFAIVAFATDQQGKAFITAPATSLFVAAAIICLLPVLYALLRRKPCRNT